MPSITRQIIPYTYLEPEALELWLEEQARQGLYLTEDVPLFVRWQKFEKRTPGHARYRVQFQEDAPSKEEKERLADLGWTYLRPLQQVQIYWTDDPAAPEFRRNGEAVADLRATARKLYKRSARITLAILLPCVLLAAWSVWTGSLLDGLLSYARQYTPPYFWLIFAMPLLLVLIFVKLAWDWFHLPKAWDDPFQAKQSRLSPTLQQRCQWAGLVLVLLFGIVPVFLKTHLYQPVSDSGAALAQLPYPLLEAFSPEEDADPLFFQGRHPLAPSLLYVMQQGDRADLDLYEYQTVAPWVAKWMTRGAITEFIHNYGRVTTDETAALPPNDLDFAAYYTEQYSFSSYDTDPDTVQTYTHHKLFLRQGTTVLYLNYSLPADEPLDLSAFFSSYATALS